jgi:hypothetical protein
MLAETLNQPYGEPGDFGSRCRSQHQINGQVHRLKIRISPGIRNQHGPERSCHALQIGRILDILMADHSAQATVGVLAR